MARYNLSIPDELMEKLKDIADEHNTTVVEVIRKSIKLGLVAFAIESKPDSALILKEGDRERQIVLL